MPTAKVYSILDTSFRFIEKCVCSGQEVHQKALPLTGCETAQSTQTYEDYKPTFKSVRLEFGKRCYYKKIKQPIHKLHKVPYGVHKCKRLFLNKMQMYAEKNPIGSLHRDKYEDSVMQHSWVQVFTDAQIIYEKPAYHDSSMWPEKIYTSHIYTVNSLAELQWRKLIHKTCSA